MRGLAVELIRIRALAYPGPSGIPPSPVWTVTVPTAMFVAFMVASAPVVLVMPPLITAGEWREYLSNSHLFPFPSSDGDGCSPTRPLPYLSTRVTHGVSRLFNSQLIPR